MTKIKIEQILDRIIQGIIQYKSEWHATGDEAAWKNLKELRALQSCYINAYADMILEEERLKVLV